ncbi:MAG: hypothetical protein ACOCXQ_02815 [Patescibacteria group bacterium]
MTIPPISTSVATLYILMLAAAVLVWIGVSIVYEQKTKSIFSVLVGIAVYFIGTIYFIKTTGTFLFAILSAVALVIIAVLVWINALDEYKRNNNKPD